jgi:hypothetical protein
MHTKHDDAQTRHATATATATATAGRCCRTGRTWMATRLPRCKRVPRSAALQPRGVHAASADDAQRRQTPRVQARARGRDDLRRVDDAVRRLAVGEQHDLRRNARALSCNGSRADGDGAEKACVRLMRVTAAATKWAAGRVLSSPTAACAFVLGWRITPLKHDVPRDMVPTMEGRQQRRAALAWAAARWCAVFTGGRGGAWPGGRSGSESGEGYGRARAAGCGRRAAELGDSALDAAAQVGLLPCADLSSSAACIRHTACGNAPRAAPPLLRRSTHARSQRACAPASMRVRALGAGSARCVCAFNRGRTWSIARSHFALLRADAYSAATIVQT